MMIKKWPNIRWFEEKDRLKNSKIHFLGISGSVKRTDEIKATRLLRYDNQKRAQFQVLWRKRPIFEFYFFLNFRVSYTDCRNKIFDTHGLKRKGCLEKKIGERTKHTLKRVDLSLPVCVESPKVASWIPKISLRLFYLGLRHFWYYVSIFLI